MHNWIWILLLLLLISLTVLLLVAIASFTKRDMWIDDHVEMRLLPTLINPKCMVVTALYDIQRESIDGRTFKQYLEWFKQTLRLNVPMTIFVDASLAKIVRMNRPHFCFTDLIVEPISKCPEYYNLPRIENAIKQMPIKNSDLCFNLAQYPMIIWSKFGWMQRAMKCHRDQYDVFIWMDAGVSRFWNKKNVIETRWPHKSWLKTIHSSNRFWLQARPNLMDQQIGEKDIGTAESVLWSTVMGGSTKIVEQVCLLAKEFLNKELLGQALIDTEQLGLCILRNRHPELFACVVPPTKCWFIQKFYQYPELVDLWMKQ